MQRRADSFFIDGSLQAEKILVKAELTNEEVISVCAFARDRNVKPEAEWTRALAGLEVYSPVVRLGGRLAGPGRKKKIK
ncbi:MAG: hypothetical protein ACKVOQ_11025 [Cyclobacteriaceae bacterium]